MNKVISAVIVLSCLVLISSFASAQQVIVAGKIYNSGFTETMDDVNVKVICGAVEDSVSTGSGYAGTYAIAFNDTPGCDGSSQIKVHAQKGTSIAESAPFSLNSLPDGERYYVIANLGLDAPVQPVVTGTSGRSGRITAVRANLTVQTAQADDTLENTDVNEDLNTEDTQDQDQPTGIARITGAVVGALGTTGTWIVVLFVVGIVAASVAVRIRNKVAKK